MNFTRHFFIEGHYLGAVTLGLERIRNGNALVPPKGNFFFCPHCCRMWAECPVEGQSGMVWSMACKNHKPGEATGGWGHDHYGMMQVPRTMPIGSIWLDWDPPFTASFPPRVMEWEFARHLVFAISAYPGPVASAAHDMLNYFNQR